MSNSLLGFSTNCFNQSDVPYDERIRLNKKLGCRAIELGFVSGNLSFHEAFVAVERGLMDNFDWISLHGPGSNTILNHDSQSRAILDAIEKIHTTRPLDLVVFHPDSIADETVFDGYTFPVGIENMDKNKSSFQRPDTLAPLLARHSDWKLIVDVNHCYTNDPTLQLAQELLTQFHGRIAEIHLSGYIKSHEALFKTKQVDIIRAVPSDIPIIIESELSSVAEARKEYLYIRSVLTNG